MRSGSRALGFTLVEMLVASTALVVILLLTASMVSHVSGLSSSGMGSGATFREARSAFETMNRVLAESVLQSYWDYDTPADPEYYLRASELHFVMGRANALVTQDDVVGNAIFAQAPIGWTEEAALKPHDGLLNTVGFYVRFSELPDLPPFLNDQRPRTRAWRLWMVQEPAEEMTVYERYNGNPQGASDFTWFRPAMAEPRYHHALADHVILLLLRAGYEGPGGDWTESYHYDSRGLTATSTFPQAPEVHQLPPVLYVTMVALETQTAERLLEQSEGAAYDLLPEDDTLFTNAANYQDDLAVLIAHLESRPIGGLPVKYRVFETTVRLTSSQWSP